MHHTRAHVAHHSVGTAKVARPNSARQTIDRGIGDANCLVITRERRHAEHRTEDFFLGQRGLRCHTRHDCRGHVVTARILKNACATKNNFTAFCDGGFDKSKVLI